MLLKYSDHFAHPAHIHADAASLHSFHICSIGHEDQERHSEYQRLRAAIFIHQRKWDVPMDEAGRERDHYDQREDPSIHIYGVYGMHAESETEHLLGGVRIFELHRWHDSMVTNEFRAVGMIPDSALACLESRYDCCELLELTRFCVQRGRWYSPPSIPTRFNCVIARDLTYAAVYHVAEQTNRWKALALVDSGYLQVMERSHFVFQTIYTQDLDMKSGYALTVIDLLATIREICAAGELARAERMMALCTEAPWLTV